MQVVQYLNEVSKFQLLSAEDEQKLFDRVSSGDAKAREIAITANLRLVINIARRYLYTKVPFQDLVQEGNAGLIKAVDKFNPKLGRRFSTYATFWIKQGVLKCLNENKNIVRQPSYVIDHSSKISKCIDRYRCEHDKLPSVNEISKEVGIPCKEILRIMDLMNLSYVSIDDKFEGASCEIFKQTTEDKMIENLEHNKIIDMVTKLKSKEKDIIVNRYGLFGNESLTLEETAKKVNLTRERVRQIQKSVIEKIRDRATYI